MLLSENTFILFGKKFTKFLFQKVLVNSLQTIVQEIGNNCTKKMSKQKAYLKLLIYLTFGINPKKFKKKF